MGWLKTTTDKVSSGSAGIGSPPHLLDELVRIQRAEIKKWWPIVEAAGIKPR